MRGLFCVLRAEADVVDISRHVEAYLADRNSSSPTEEEREPDAELMRSSRTRSSPEAAKTPSATRSFEVGMAHGGDHLTTDPENERASKTASRNGGYDKVGPCRANRIRIPPEINEVSTPWGQESYAPNVPRVMNISSVLEREK